jgi:hypothetical protein
MNDLKTIAHHLPFQKPTKAKDNEQVGQGSVAVQRKEILGRLHGGGFQGCIAGFWAGQGGSQLQLEHQRYESIRCLGNI